MSDPERGLGDELWDQQAASNAISDMYRDRAVKRPWPGWCQSCQAELDPPDATWCRSCGADDFED
ncbi:hypothetical protein BKG68_12665 [Mycobacteroides saopaulense]|uniref:RanBP2-type domain-containing protein n=1 Tax=Mycobacteroides saopaulense TaxID=1578165 RepID=A0ABX3BYG6_9MYCO|nr:hypothetical protein BKG68_12665 [Mycobacteroides saopaulense]OHU08784.1 hypothetical protein BKG73_17360 [Mycobacteroides saopaulense]